MKLYIDNRLCLTDAATAVPSISFDAADLRSFKALRAGRRYRLSIPICRQNREIIGYDDRILAATSFNDAEHKARIEFDGVTLIEGTVLLFGTECAPKGDRYSIEIISGAHEWARTASLRQIDEVGIDFSANNALFTIPTTVTPYEPTLMYQPSGSSSYIPCPNDWALYGGYVEMTGQTEVEVEVATAPREVSASEPFEFRNIAFGGAAAGQSMTLYASTRAYPSFQPNPALGSTFTLADVLHHDMRQVDLLEALAQMFNLRFYTDPIERNVYIESAADMVDRESVIDWSDRIVHSQPILICSAATDSDEGTLHRYLVGDGAVGRYNQQHDDRFGEWIGEVRSKLADEGTRDACNPIFAPTINATEIFSLAPSVSLPQVGDRDADDPAQLNFPTKILLYNGVKNLPDNERWGLIAAAYPHAAFHSAEGSLCFEDRDGEEGLHRYFDAHYEELNSARRVTLSLQLSAADLLPIITTDPAGRDLRSVFRLTIGGEEGLYRLEAIEEWHEEEHIARCRFVQLV